MANSLLSSTTIAGFPALTTSGRSDRPPVLFVHGAFVTHESFAPWLGVMQRAGWRTVAASRRGRLGVGPAQCEGVTTADYLEDTLKVIDALGEPPIVVGHSLGGLIAQKVAEQGKCAAVVLMSPAPPKMLPAQLVSVPALLTMLPRILAGRPVRPGCNACSTIALNRIPVQERAALHAKLVEESGAVYREIIFGSIKVDRAKVTCPMLVVNGGQDRIVSASLARWVANYYGARVKIYENNAHWLMDEPGWEKIAGDVAGWMAALPQAAFDDAQKERRRA